MILYEMASVSNPFEDIHRVDTAQELLDQAFNKAMKIKPPASRGDELERSRTHELNRINTAANVLTDRLESVVDQFPSIDQIHPFYQEMCELFVGVDQVKISLGRVYGIISTIRNVQRKISDKMASTGHKSENKQLRKQAFGRFSSIIYQLSDHFEILEEIKEKVATLPGIDPTVPTVAITGIPNAGKSSFIRNTTSGKPEIASYPFTTKSITFGHMELDFLSIQFVDTPGLLDRPLDKRNEIEVQALLALQYLSDIMVFFYDPTKEASCTPQEQINLLKEIIEFYPGLSLIIAITKCDITSAEQIKNAKHLIADEIELAEPSDIFEISTLIESEYEEMVDHIQTHIRDEVLKTRKFRHLNTPKIAEDQLILDDEK